MRQPCWPCFDLCMQVWFSKTGSGVLKTHGSWLGEGGDWAHAGKLFFRGQWCLVGRRTKHERIIASDPGSSEGSSGAAAEGDRCCRSKKATGWGFGKIAECCQQTGPRAASDQEHCEDNFRWDGWPEWDPGACLANCPRHAFAVQGKPRCWGWLFMIVCHHLSSVLIRIFQLWRNHFNMFQKASQWLVQIDARMGIDMYWPRASGCETVWRGAHEACQPWCAFFVAGQSWRWWDQIICWCDLNMVEEQDKVPAAILSLLGKGGAFPLPPSDNFLYLFILPIGASATWLVKRDEAPVCHEFV